LATHVAAPAQVSNWHKREVPMLATHVGSLTRSRHNDLSDCAGACSLIQRTALGPILDLVAFATSVALIGSVSAGLLKEPLNAPGCRLVTIAQNTVNRSRLARRFQ